ncbi:stonustoxin subunit beta-like isoform X2 [Sphaeramia orbicularis]|uniref:stonustoxin subunit beta-like isoform X2 n=1 Tax=Sphaeramia orbicularis TaxID=375764 RepID=UPI00117EE0B1|nr:stonustoxin subunit beta-like isoform X2 [Sphaeramia orbicularis]
MATKKLAEDMEEVKKSLNFMSEELSKVAKQQTGLLDLIEEMRKLKEVIREKDKKIDELERRVEDLEQCIRMDDLMITGLKTNHCTYASITAGLTLRVKQTLKDFITVKSQISSSYHVLTSDTTDSKSSRNEDFTRPHLPDVRTITDRNEFIWYFCDLTLDPNSAHQKLRLSNGNKTATCGGVNSYPQKPERFIRPEQVMCREELNRRHYWEVDWSNSSNDDVGVGVAYKSLNRYDGYLGGDTKSWLFVNRYGSYYRLHGEEQKVAVPSGDFRRIGVFLDWPAGTLSYYKVSSNTLTHLHTFYNTFTEPVFTAFFVGTDSSYVTLHPFN